VMVIDNHKRVYVLPENSLCLVKVLLLQALRLKRGSDSGSLCYPFQWSCEGYVSEVETFIFLMN
jgi:hypothetical protein